MDVQACFKSPLGHKSRAKSLPNLGARMNTNIGPVRWVHDSRTGDNYAIGQLLGKGGFAKCFLARKAHIAKIRKEIYSHFSLRHSNVVALYNTFEDTENIYMLLEYCPNLTLADHIDSSAAQGSN
ncbi:Serine/threonine-protein kinase plk2 [Globodera pallida]|nr:Serine/threonine-protein kinase plk2 [Globodera pallida]